MNTIVEAGRLTPVWNETTFPTREVAKIVRWTLRRFDTSASSLGRRPDLLVKVKHHRGSHPYQGRYYPAPRTQRVVRVPVGVHHLIVCRISPSPDVYPGIHDKRLRGGPPTIQVENWQEALVGITAHEAQHVWQRLNRRGFSEVECEWQEFRAIRDWRAKAVRKEPS